MRIELTDRACRASKPGDLFDSKQRGLNLRTTAAGARTWYCIFTAPDGRRARATLGRFPIVTLARARTMALEVHQKVAEGIDPRQEGSASMTVGALVEAFIEKHALKLKTGKAYRTRLRNNVLPVIGNVKLSELHRRDIHRMLDKIEERGSPLAASKAQQDVRTMVRWAIQRGYLDADPMLGMQAAQKSKPRERFLAEEEIAKVWPALSILAKPVELALKLALVLGQRIGEVCAMHEDELDLAKAVWVIPSSKTKNAHQHTVPLTAMALELIAEARAGAICGRIFPTFTSVKLGHALQAARPRLPISDWSAHDLRRSVCTHLAMAGVSPVTIGAVVNHVTSTKSGTTLQTYIQYDVSREKRLALEMWSERLQAILAGDSAQIIPMNRNAR
jgi:integrase